MAVDYAAFLRQTPWYQYPFTREVGELWAAPTGGSLRGWERRFGIGLEFAAKAAYAKVIGGAVAATAPATADDPQRRVRDSTKRSSRAFPTSRSSARAATVSRSKRRATISSRASWSRSPAVAARIQEIAGNDDIMVTLTVPPGAGCAACNAAR